MLKAQLESVFSDIPPQAVKTGMLATTEIMEIIGKEETVSRMKAAIEKLSK